MNAAADTDRARIKAERAKHESPIKITYSEDGKKMLAAEGGLIDFIRYFWNEIEPGREYKEGWAIWTIAKHLEACANGEITRLTINVSPGAMKSLMTAVFFPAWIWATRDASTRFISFSYGAHLTQRDNSRFMRLLLSSKFQEMYPEIYLVAKGKIKTENSATGWKFASSVGGVGTGERADFLLIDDPLNVAEVGSKVVREAARSWFLEAASNRLNDMDRSVVIVIGQRAHEGDLFGVIEEKKLHYEHLIIPCEYEAKRHHSTSIWSDPRSRDGECFFPERFTPTVIANCKALGPVVWAGQYQQRPGLDAEAIFPRKSWKMWTLPKFPKFKIVLACLDMRFGDLTSMTIWGGVKNNAMLVYAWRKELKLKGKNRPIIKGETFDQYRDRTQDEWGVAEQVTDDCRRFKADRLLIFVDDVDCLSVHELKKSMKLTCPVDFIPAKGDEDRVISIQHVLDDGQIYYSDTKYAENVISECELYPFGERDGLVKSACRAWSWLRLRGYLPRASEIVKTDGAIPYRRPKLPLYPCMRGY